MLILYQLVTQSLTILAPQFLMLICYKDCVTIIVKSFYLSSFFFPLQYLHPSTRPLLRFSPPRTPLSPLTSRLRTLLTFHLRTPTFHLYTRRSLLTCHLILKPLHHQIPFMISSHIALSTVMKQAPIFHFHHQDL